MDISLLNRLRFQVLKDLCGFVPKRRYELSLSYGEKELPKDEAWGILTLGIAARLRHEADNHMIFVSSRQSAAIDLLYHLGDLASIKHRNIEDPDESEVTNNIRILLKEYLEHFEERTPFVLLLRKECATDTKRKKKKPGRPATVKLKTPVIKQIIETLLDGQAIDTDKGLPGSADELLYVCKSIAKVIDGSDVFFNCETEAFKGWVKKAVKCGFKNGDMPHIEASFWRDRYDLNLGKIPRDIFSQVIK